MKHFYLYISCWNGGSDTSHHKINQNLWEGIFLWAGNKGITPKMRMAANGDFDAFCGRLPYFSLFNYIFSWPRLVWPTDKIITAVKQILVTRKKSAVTSLTIEEAIQMLEIHILMKVYSIYVTDHFVDCLTLAWENYFPDRLGMEFCLYRRVLRHA